MYVSKKLTWDKLIDAHKRFIKEEPRDAMYKVSTKLINENWNNDSEISTALGILLLTWNSAFYRYGSLDYDLIQKAVSKNKRDLNMFRKRNILSCEQTDRDKIKLIYECFLDSLRRQGKPSTKNEGKISYSPVSVVKALHLLCPTFFPLWDDKIAKSYGCSWSSSKSSFDKYWMFMMIIKEQIPQLCKDTDRPSELNGANPLKLIDEYNYVKFTLGVKII